MSIFVDCASDALTSIGQLGVGQSASPEQLNQALRVANRMIAKWSLQKLMLYVVDTIQVVLSGTQQNYTLGPTGSTASIRPTFIEAAQVTIPGTAMELSMNLLNKTEWGAINDRGAMTSSNGVPSDLWTEYSIPNLGLHVWPIPQTSVVMTLAAWLPLQQFASVFDPLNFPPGYEEAIVVNLAFELAPYYDMPQAPLAQLAADGLLKIQGINAQTLGKAIGDSRTLDAPNLALPLPSGPPPGAPTQPQ